MMAGARDELSAAVEQMAEEEVDLVLSFVHLLRASREDAVSALVSALAGEGRPEGLAWSTLSERSLARDWERAEEDEAWADL